jgi:uncharacterized ferritin-like protein (DUF455 family)
MSFIENAALSVLTCSSPSGKVEAARAAWANWQEERLTHYETCNFEEANVEFSLPERPARPKRPPLTEPNEVPKRKFGSPTGRIALLHALAHIELNAIDLAFDMAAHFFRECERKMGQSIEFIDDWLKVGAEEAEHFVMLEQRLQDMGSHYGALNAHDGLWQAAIETRNDWRARLAVVPMVLEARGLDVTPQTLERLTRHGDEESAVILEKIYRDEIRHVAAGVRWFNKLCVLEGISPKIAFDADLAAHFRGNLKGPFNESARVEAGFLPDLYRSPSQ